MDFISKPALAIGIINKQKEADDLEERSRSE